MLCKKREERPMLAVQLLHRSLAKLVGEIIINFYGRII
jgi:hypothetical protein